ncbi:MAG: hypothetical protein GEV12_22550 [Micromonosporaceae bacterium]|nr:hypothetical protein [Micromonosporaceae bacterium]
MAADTTTGRRSYEAARRRRAELLQAIQSFEQAVAAPAGGPAWRERVRRRLRALRDQLAEHMVVTEGPDGLYAELLEHAPRLDRPVAGLVAEHQTLVVRADSLARWLRPDREVERVRQRAGDLLSALSRHRQRGADLVYEAYAMDIGGET